MTKTERGRVLGRTVNAIFTFHHHHRLCTVTRLSQATHNNHRDVQPISRLPNWHLSSVTRWLDYFSIFGHLKQ